MTLIHVSAIIFFILFFPLKVNFYGYFDVLKNRYFFGLFLFEVKLFSGYFYLDKKGVTVLLGKRSKKTVSLYEVFEFEKVFKPFKGYWLSELSFVAQFGALDPCLPLSASVLLSTLSRGVFSAINTVFSKIKFKADYIVKTTETSVNFNVKISVLLNIFIVIFSVVKIILERIFKWGKSVLIRSRK